MTAALSDGTARELISVDGLDRTLFVEAGAGTGKTTQLVSRIVNTVLERGVRLSEIAAITFTEAAASELQARIRVEFERHAATDDARLKELAEQAIADADLAAISTVHGFASRILSEFSVAAGLPPRVSVLDEVASQLANEDRWDRFVDWLNNEHEFDELMYRAALLDVPLTPTYHGQASLKDVAVNFAQNWDRLSDLTDGTVGGAMSPLDFGAFDRAVAEVADAPSLCTNTDDKLFHHLGRIVPVMRAAASIVDPNRKLRHLQSLFRSSDKGRVWGPSGTGSKANWTVEPKEVKALILEVNAAVKAVLDDASVSVLEPLMRLAAQEVVKAAESRQADGRLEFHDLLVLARRVLRQNGEVRRSLHDRYRHVLLDEFQDTDPIQIELASLIAATPSETQPERWQDHDVAGGRLFFVGDPKQSIYRFRRADIKLFLEARDTFADQQGAVRLDTNFRTVPPIIDWINGVFATAMPDEVPDAQPKYEPLHAGRSFESATDHRPLVFGGEHADPKVNAAVLRETEAADVGDIVANIMESPEAWPVHDRETGGWRPARASDITILIPTRTSLPFLRESLGSREIPYRLATGTLVYDTQEVSDALAVLRAIDDPNDTLSLIAALRSPLYGCSDVDLFVYHQARSRWDISKDAPDALTADHPVVRAMAHLNELWRHRWWLSPATMLERVLRERRGFLLGYGTRRPVEVWRRLRFLIDQARAFEESNGGGLRSFLEWAALQSADGARVHEPMLPETDDDALQIITVHGSKGLEFPITILSGMTTATKGKQNGVSVLWSDGGAPEVKLRSGVATAEHTARADLEEDMGGHEKLRLLYVAATRARDHLIVSGHHKASKDANSTYAHRIAGFSVERPELSRQYVRSVAGTPSDVTADAGDQVHRGEHSTASSGSTGPTGSAIASRNQWIAERAELLAPFRASTTMSATAIARTVDASIADVDDDSAADSEGPADRPIVRKKGRAGSAIGSAVHATLEYIDFNDPADLDALAKRQCELHSIDEHLDTVGALVRSALASEAVALARRNASFRELYVGAPVGGIMIEGYIDLLVQTADGLVIVDYKTDSASSPAEIDAKLAAYELQGAAYAVALEESTGIDVVDCRFVFCKARGAIERSVPDLAMAKQRVRNTIAAGLQPTNAAVSTDTIEQLSPLSD